MTPTALWRRVRRHFSIDAPRMAVRSHLPWPWKAVLGVALLFVIGGEVAHVYGGRRRWHRHEAMEG